MKSLMALLHWVLIDLGTRCGTSTTADGKTISRRVEAEGVSFLTISLANFGKDFQKSLDQGYVSDEQYPGFARTAGLPRFLSGFLRLVFDARSGRLLENPSVDAIYSVRQLTLMWAKIALPSTPEREKDAYTKYLECEQDVRQADQNFLSDPNLRRSYSRLGRLLWADLFTTLDERVYYGELLPKHGPGATADKLKGNLKWTQQEWTARLERVAPHWEHLVPSPRYLDRVSAVTILEPSEERPSKVISVPKDARGPRLIAVEPTCMQYMQQAVLAQIVELIDGNDICRDLISSRSQQPNQLLAQLGSLTGSVVATGSQLKRTSDVSPVETGHGISLEPHTVGLQQGLATLDLSEASDRVSSQHVRALLENHPNLLEIVDASRTRKADVPGHGVIRLAKFASMGSALCFPFESIVFATVCFLGIEKSLSRPLTKKDIKSLIGRVRVYGDDIIVPVEHVQSVVEALETFGFRVNRNKSFWTGKFRESCGKDYYAGTDISVVRIRQPLPNDRTQVEQVVSTVSLRNQLFHAGFTGAVDYLDSLIERIIPFPEVHWTKVENDSPIAPSLEENAISTRSGTIVQSSPALGKHSWGPCQGPYQLSGDLQKPMVRAAVVSAKSPSSEIDDYAALQKWFLMRGEHPFEDKDHLLRAGRPDSVRIKIRMVPLY